MLRPPRHPISRGRSQICVTAVGGAHPAARQKAYPVPGFGQIKRNHDEGPRLRSRLVRDAATRLPSSTAPAVEEDELTVTILANLFRLDKATLDIVRFCGAASVLGLDHDEMLLQMRETKRRSPSSRTILLIPRCKGFSTSPLCSTRRAIPLRFCDRQDAPSDRDKPDDADIGLINSLIDRGQRQTEKRGNMKPAHVLRTSVATARAQEERFIWCKFP